MRVKLRPFVREDFSDLYEYLSDAQTVAFEPYEAMTEQEVRNALDGRIGCGEWYAIEELSTGKLVGHIYLGSSYCEECRELGYILNRAYWGRGYAFEAVSEVCRRAFAQGIHRIEAKCDPLNTASWKLLERLGFVREGYLKQDIFFRRDAEGRPIWKDTYIYSCLAGNFFSADYPW